MNSRELGKSLLSLDLASSPTTPDPRAMASRIVQRDQRRVRWLTALTIVIWVIAVGMVLWMLIAFGLLFPRQAKLRMDYEQGLVTETVREQVQMTHQVALQMIMLGIAASVGVLGLAALSTVGLVLVTRRATLRQINANLIEISQQLKQLAQEHRN